MRYQSTIFTQLLKEFPRYQFERLVKKHKGDYRTRSFKCWDQFISLMYGQLAHRNSLRDLENSFNSHYNHWYHLGCNRVKRSTLADANNKRSYKIFEEVFQKLLSRFNTSIGKELSEVVKIIDATVIKLNETQFSWALGQVGGGIKIHTVYDLNQEIPTLFEITHSRISDITYSKSMPLESGSTYVFDKGYYDFKWWKEITDKDCLFVTRLKKNSPTRLVKKFKTYSKNILSDEKVLLNERMASSRKNPYNECLRKVSVVLENKNSSLVLITNDFKRSAEEIADLYKKRWQIELFFKWIKQNLKIKKFFGTSENAVKIQIIVALITYLLMQLLKLKNDIKSSLQTIIRQIQVNIFQRKSILDLFKPPPIKDDINPYDYQLEISYV